MILRRFHLNPGTGGNGFHRGGDGVVRELLFRRAQVLSVLGERRAFRPYGIKGKVMSFRNVKFPLLQGVERQDVLLAEQNTDPLLQGVERQDVLLAEQNTDKTVYSVRLELKKCL